MPLVNLNWRRLNCGTFIALVLMFTLFFNEYLVYRMQSLRWPTFPKSDQRKDDVVMLLVGDPQLQGYRDEPPWITGSLSRWDADRYLRNNFQIVMGSLRPDVVIFVGDLLDEGSVATNEDYADYKHRFEDIFSTLENVQKVYIPGDNDVGGEGRDFRSQLKLDRFIKNFQEVTGVTHVKFVDLVRLDVEFHSGLSTEKKHVVTGLTAHLSAPYRVMLNHESVLTKLKAHIYPLLKPIHPQLIISAHWHKSNHYVCDDCMSHKSDVETEYWPVHRRDITQETKLIEFDLHNVEALNEIMVPSCSYRMGESNIGYGVVVISNAGMAYHGVLWLPQRYLLLYLYLVVLTILTGVYLVRKIVSKRINR